MQRLLNILFFTSSAFPNAQAKSLAYLQLHVTIFLWGFTAILGRLISLPETSLVWWRLLFTLVALSLYPAIFSNIRKISRKHIMVFALNGCIISLHWVFFYGAIKYSNVSVTLSFIATASIFSSFTEPFFTKRKFNPVELLLGLLVVPGVYLVFKFSGNYILGIVLSVISALLSATFTSVNKRLINHYNSASITFIELAAGFVFISALLPVINFYLPNQYFWPQNTDWIYIIIMAVVCTAYAYILGMLALKQLSAFTTTLSLNLEPIYGITLAIIIFNENRELGWQFFAGTAIILVTVFVQGYLTKLSERKKKATS